MAAGLTEIATFVQDLVEVDCPLSREIWVLYSLLFWVMPGMLSRVSSDCNLSTHISRAFPSGTQPAPQGITWAWLVGRQGQSTAQLPTNCYGYQSSVFLPFEQLGNTAIEKCWAAVGLWQLQARNWGLAAPGWGLEHQHLSVWALKRALAVISHLQDVHFLFSTEITLIVLISVNISC